MNLILNYAAIGFRPYKEIGEFVNVGVVAVEAKSRFLSYRLISPQKTKRIRACFPELDLSLFRNGVRRLESELSTLAIETNQWSDDNRGAGASHPSQGDLFIAEGDIDFFKELTAPHQSTFFYGPRGTRLATDIEDCLDELFEKYVEHWNLAPVDNEEKRMTRDVRKLLQRNRLDRIYREAPWVGTDAYHVGVPLAFTPRGAELPSKVIKPLNLDKVTPTRIYTHGDEWLAKVQRLRSISCLPEAFLFVVKKPRRGEERQAADDICASFIEAGVEVVEIEDEDAIAAFARMVEPTDLELKKE